VSWLVPVGTPGGICSGFGGIEDGSGIVRLGRDLISLGPDLYRVWTAAADAPQVEQLYDWAAAEEIEEPADLVRTLVEGELLVEEKAGVVDQVGGLAMRLIGECRGNGAGRAEFFRVAGPGGAELEVDPGTHEILLRSDGVGAIGVLCDALDDAVGRGGRVALRGIVDGLPQLVRSNVVRLDMAVWP
jgi:hypothetical protein